MSSGWVGETAQFWSRMIKEEEERRAREALLGWLPRPLRWLVDHPMLLRLYLRLPHRTEIIARCEDPYSTAQYLVVPRGRRS